MYYWTSPPRHVHINLPRAVGEVPDSNDQPEPIEWMGSSTSNWVVFTSASSLAVCTSHHNCITQVGTYTRTVTDIQHTGTNKHVLISPDNTCLALLTSGNAVHFLDVHIDQNTTINPITNISHLIHNASFHYWNPSWKLTFTLRFRCEVPETAGSLLDTICVDRLLLLSTSDGYIRCVGWNGQSSKRKFAMSQTLSPAHTLKYNADRHLLCAIFQDGQCAVWQVDPDTICNWFLSKETTTAFVPPKAQIVSKSSTCSLSINPNYPYIALGLSTGHVLLYNDELHEIHQTFQEKASSCGPSTCLDWTSDGTCLLVGYQTRGLTLWHWSGCRLSSTLPFYNDSSSSSSSSSLAQLFEKGCHRITWTNGSFSALASDTATKQLHQIDMYNVSLWSSSRPCWPVMCTWDRLERLRITSDPNSDHSTYRSEYLVPSHYLHTINGHIEMYAISENGTHFAIASSMGMALYNGTKQKWRVFGNTNSEEKYKIFMLQWISEYHILCVAQERENETMYRMMVYPRTHLDEMSIAGRMELYSRPHRIALSKEKDRLVMVFDQQIVVYYMNVTPPKLWKKMQSTRDLLLSVPQIESLQFHFEIEIQLDIVFLYRPVQLEIVSKPSEKTIGLLYSTTNHCLKYVDLYTCQTILYQTDCILFWLSPWSQHNPQPLLWTYSFSLGFVVYLPLSATSEEFSPSQETRQIFAYSVEFYPVGIDPVHGTILSLSQTSHISPLHIDFHTQSYITTLLSYYLIETRLPLMAGNICDQFQTSRFLYSSLDLFLHLCMTTNPARLPNVLEFLRQLSPSSYYYDLVASCARKSDFQYWTKLFAQAGPPLDLFKQCCRLKQYDTASRYLLILQRVEGSLIAHQAGVYLLGAVVGAPHPIDLRLCIHLLRFLWMSRQRNASNYDKGAELQRIVSNGTEPKPLRLSSTRSKDALPVRRPYVPDTPHKISTKPKSKDEQSEPSASGMLSGVLDWLAW